MTDAEAYAEGFRKTAEDNRIDPDELVKVAQSDWMSSISEYYKNLDPSVKKSIIGGLAGGAGTFLLSDGDLGERMMKSVAAGGLTGLGTYGLDQTGALDQMIDFGKSKWKDFKAYNKRRKVMNILNSQSEEFRNNYYDQLAERLGIS